MVNFGPLAAEIISLVWGTPCKFQRVRVLAALQHGTLVVNRTELDWNVGRGSEQVLKHIDIMAMDCNRVPLVMVALCNRADHYIFAL